MYGLGEHGQDEGRVARPVSDDRQSHRNNAAKALYDCSDTITRSARIKQLPFPGTFRAHGLEESKGV